MDSQDKLKVLLVSSEVNPYAKSGGLGDVIGSLPKELVKRGVDARVVFPKYKHIDKTQMKNLRYMDSVIIKRGWREDAGAIFTFDSEVPTYMIGNDFFFERDGFYGYGDDYERFAFFCEAVIHFINKINFKPDVIHINDWQTGLLSVYLKDNYGGFMFFKDIKTLYTIHNMQYQGNFGREILNNINLNDGYFVGDKIEYFGNVNYMKAGIVYSDMISTVSETYAKEIQTSGFGYGLDGLLKDRSDRLFGILNGIDIETNNPETDKRIFVNFNKDELGKKYECKKRLQAYLNLPVRDVPIFSIISRLVNQKGLDLIQNIMEELMYRDIQLIILGTGDFNYENMFKHYSYRFPDKVSANICFNSDLAQKIYAGSDIFLMPSLFEPCGLGQMFAMRYGTIPIARKTGGLNDTIKHFNAQTGEGTGFLFEDYLPSGLMWAINEAMNHFYNMGTWHSIVKNAMSQDFSWGTSAEKYIQLYEALKNQE